MGTPPQTVVRAAQPCSLPFSSLVPSPQHRREGTASATSAEHPVDLLLLLQTSPSLSGSSQAELPLRRTAIFREKRCLKGPGRCLSRPLLRSLSLRARAPTSASSLLLPSPRSGSLARARATTPSPAQRAAASTPQPAASGCRRSRRRSRRTCPPGSGPLLEAVTLSQAPQPPQG